MSKAEKEEDDRIVFLRFSDSEDLRNFFQVFKDSGFGSLVKVGDSDDYSNNKEKSGKETKFSKLGLSKYDEKSSEKPSLI